VKRSGVEEPLKANIRLFKAIFHRFSHPNGKVNFINLFLEFYGKKG
jgi:hypothetical protein